MQRIIYLGSLAGALFLVFVIHAPERGSAVRSTAIEAERHTTASHTVAHLASALSSQNPVRHALPRATIELHPQPDYWYEGAVRRPLWRCTEQWLEFSPSPESLRRLRRAGFEPEAAFETDRFVRCWRGAAARIQSFWDRDRRQADLRCSPVFLDQAQGSMRRALPGDVLVFFDPSWRDPQVEAFALRWELQALRRLPLAGNVYLVKTEAGLGALQLANEIYESGEVLGCEPNWWLEAYRPARPDRRSRLGR